MTLTTLLFSGRPLARSLCALFATCASLTLAPMRHAYAAEGAQKETEGLIAAYRTCCPDKTRSAGCQAVDPFFDYTHLAKTTLAPLRKKLSVNQQRRLVVALEDIFARTARQSGQSLCHAEPKIGSATPHEKGSEVALDVVEPGEDVPTRLAFVWRKANNRWRVVDLELEGGSLITDYQNQFSRIEHKEGAEGLIRRIEARRQEKQESAPKPASTSAD